MASFKAPQTVAPMQAAMAADELWKFQLRKENKAILDRVVADRKRSDSQEAEFKRLLQIEQDKNEALAARILELENASLTREQRNELQLLLERCRTNRDAFFISGIMGDQEKANTEQRWAERRQLASASAMPRPPAPLRQLPGGPAPARPQIAPSPHRPQPIMRMDPTDANPHADSSDFHPFKENKLDDPHQLPSGIQRMTSIVELGANEEANNPVTGSSPTKKPRKAPVQEIQGPQTRSRQLSSSIEAPISKHQPAASASACVPAKPLRLIQGKRPIDVYYNDANEIFATIPDTGREGEVDFVNLFLKGIQATKNREKVTEVLQQLYESKHIGKNVRVVCQWDQVLEGLVRANLVQRVII